LKRKRLLQGTLVAVLLLKGILAGISWQNELLAERSAVAEEEEGRGSAGQRGSNLQGCEQTANLRSVLEAIAKKDKALSRRERLLRERETQVMVIEKDVATKISRLEELEGKLGVTIRKMEEEHQVAGESLAKIYSSMKPAEAARILSSLDEKTVLKIFAGMKERSISQILPLVNRELAVALTSRLANRGLISNSTPTAKP